MRERRVVVTGLGAVSPLGNDTKSTWEGLIQGKNGIGPVTRFDTEGIDSKIAAELKDFDPTRYIDFKEARRMDPFTHYGIAAGMMAVKDAAIEGAVDGSRAGVIVTSGIGGMIIYDAEHRKLIEKGPQRISPFFIPAMIPDITSGHLSIKYGFLGPNYVTVSACASSAHAIGCGYMHIQRGDADVMLVGGAEGVMTPMAFAGFSNMRAVSTRNDDPAHASRPFDRERDGFVIGEGSGVVVLEELSRAKKRGATIYAELAGISFTADGYHITAPHPEGKGAILAMNQAMEEAGINPEEVDYINAHGTSTPFNDRTETLAIKSVFAGHAGKVMVSSIKSMVGHLLGAAGGMEFLSTALTVYHGVVPPTINYEVPDPDCDLDYVPNEARKADVRVALSNSFGFGGHNACLCLKKFKS